MHPIFLIDEILQEILLACMADGLRSLSQVARCIKAWEEPAKDLLWARLPSAEPLLRVIPALYQVDGTYMLDETVPLDLTTFRSYAQRVKRITHNDSIRADAKVISLLADLSSQSAGLLPDLTHVQMKNADCNTLRASLSMSPKLRDVDLRIGFKTEVTSAPHYNLCQYLQTVKHAERLKLRGLLCQPLNQAIAAMVNLRTLTLHTGSSLASETLTAILSFPRLSELDIHAGHLEADSIVIIPPTLPSLKNLRIRIHSALANRILDSLQPNTLETLHIEFVDDGSMPILWNTILTSLAATTATSLHTLHIEHHIDLEEISIVPNTPHRDAAKYAIDIINPNMAQLVSLRQLIVDTTYPIKLTDGDVRGMVERKQWRALEHLSLGSHTVVPLTLTSLVSFSRYERLKSLAISLNIKQAPPSPVNSTSDVLQHVTLTMDADLITDAVRTYVAGLLPVAEIDWKETV